MTDVLDVQHGALDDLTSTAETKPKAAAPEPAGTTCRYCTKTFTGGARFVQRGLHEKREHPSDWQRAKAGVKPKAKKAAKKPASTRTSGPKPPPSAKRHNAGEAISSIAAMAAQLMVRVDAPVGRALAFSAPATGDAVDELVAGTFVDKKVVQPLVGVADKWEKVGGIIAFPVLIAVISHNPALFQPLEAQLRSATVDVINASIPTLKKRAANEKKAADSLAELGKIDPRYAESNDPIRLILEDIFGVQIVAPEGDGAD